MEINITSFILMFYKSVATLKDMMIIIYISDKSKRLKLVIDNDKKIKFNGL